ncbi:MAG: PTS sugar transporter subunit IIA [Desulfobacterota bacterium]|nr:PTS sugar transporter subunit IIA [Thermodesulfobacteriota bacterium]MDW8001294.1 PTS sugar transporter subunit IIA [Deltaproteobacteria bacterium]
MDSLLDALQEGRLFELPENEKKDALQFLAHVIEAFPEIPPDTDVVGLVMKREETVNTALGKGWACPHARVPFEEDLKCVVGWSPQGIEYGAPDGKPVHLIVMYLVPENQRNHYLREVSMIAKAIETYPDVEKIRYVSSLNDVRNYLLDLIDSTKETIGPDSRARMIRLQARPQKEAYIFHDLSNLIIEPMTIVAVPKTKPLILTHNPALLEQLQWSEDLVEKIENEGVFHAGGWRILRKASNTYQGGIVTYDCIGVKLKENLTK